MLCFKIIILIEHKESLSAPKKPEYEKLEALLHDDSYHSFVTFIRIRNGSIAGTLGDIRVETEKLRTETFHNLTTASTAENNRFLHRIAIGYKSYNNP